MHPWIKIFKGNTEELETKSCFMCLEKIPNSDDDIWLKVHIFKVHLAEVHLRKLVEICGQVEETGKSKSWGLDNILKEERDRKGAELRMREKTD